MGCDGIEADACAQMAPSQGDGMFVAYEESPGAAARRACPASQVHCDMGALQMPAKGVPVCFNSEG